MSNTKLVLIIDDEPFNVEILTEHLIDEDYKILSAENGKIGLELLQKNSDTIDAVLLDRMMPVMNGMEFLEAIQNDDVLKNIPIIMQTAASSDSEIIEGINAGAYYYLTKPFEADVMLSIVKAAISDYTRKRELHGSTLSYQNIGSLVKSLEFHFKTLEEADNLSKMISNLYPIPEKVIMGITELLINSVEHGNLGITYSEKTELIKSNNWKNEVNNRGRHKNHIDKYVTVIFLRDITNITLTIEDQGDGFDYNKYLKVDPSRAFDPHGRGIAVAAMISFNNVEFMGKGNKVQCTVKI